MGESLQSADMEPAMLLKLARERLGISQGRFGRLVGKNHSTISRRESGTISIPEQSVSLAHMIIRMAGEVDVEAILEVLESVPHKRRSEPSAMLVLAGLAARLGKFHLVENMTSDEGPIVESPEEDSESEEEQDMHRELRTLTHLLEDFRKDLRKRSSKASARAREKFEQASLALATASELVAMGIADEEDEHQRKLKDDGGGGG